MPQTSYLTGRTNGVYYQLRGTLCGPPRGEQDDARRKCSTPKGGALEITSVSYSSSRAIIVARVVPLEASVDSRLLYVVCASTIEMSQGRLEVVRANETKPRFDCLLYGNNALYKH